MLTILILLLAVFQSSHLDTSVVVTSQKQRLASFASGKSKRKEEKLSQKEDGAPNDNCKLACEQSLGYFDDISEENWIRAQRIHAKLFPNHFSKTLRKHSNGPNGKGGASKLEKSHMWNAENFQEEFHCSLAQRIPTDSQADGSKWVCDPHRLKKKKDCMTHSVGSNGKAEFEKAVKEEIGDHCEVRTFDIADYDRRNGNFSEALKGYSTFYHWGIGTEEESLSSDRFKTLKETMKELGHTDRTIDIFKIDCEWCEWFTFRQWIQEDLRQILVETHNVPVPNAIDFFYELHDAGFVIFSKEANFQNGGGGVEFAFLKLSTDFFVDGSIYGERKEEKDVK